MDFFNNNGEATIYLHSGKYFYSFDGIPLGYLYGNMIYAFTGEHLGWYEGYWIRDLYGRCMYFAENCPNIDGPCKPYKQFKQFKSFKQILPTCCFKQFPFLKPYKLNVWSPSSEKEFWHCDE